MRERWYTSSWTSKACKWQR